MSLFCQFLETVVSLIIVLVVILAVCGIVILLICRVVFLIVVCRAVAVVTSVIVVVLIIIRHLEFLLWINSYRSSMSKTHKNMPFYPWDFSTIFVLIF